MAAPINPNSTIPDINSGVYYESRTSTLYRDTIALQTLSTLFVILRFISRKVSGAGFWWDDWAIIPALILMIHQIFYFICSFFFKTSLILLYYRVFGVSPGFRKVLIVAWSLVLCYFVGDVLAAIFECKPMSFYWDKSILGGKCVDTVAFYRWNGVAGACMDLMILTLTVPMIWRLSLRASQKIQLTGVFMVGSFVFAASIIRVTTFSQVVLPDITYTLVNSSKWSTMEQAIGVICACLPVMPQLVKRVFGMRTRADDSDRFNSKSKKRSDGSDDGPSSQNNRFGNMFPMARRLNRGTDQSNIKTDYDADIHGFARIEETELGIPHGVSSVDERGVGTLATEGDGGSHLPKGVGRNDLNHAV